MTSKLAESKARVLIIEPQQFRRAMMLDTFKQLGFGRCNLLPTLKDALSFIEMENEPPEWIITPLMEDGPVNAAHLLSLSLSDPYLRHLRISLVLEPAQHYCLRNAFEMGLLSYHPKASDLMTQMASFSELLHLGKSLQWNECLMAAHYLRTHLKEKALSTDLVTLEKSLLATFQDRPEQIVSLAQALYLDKKPQPALMLLARAQGLDAKASAEAQKLADTIAADQNIEAAPEETSFAASLGLDYAVIVDPDEAMQKLAKTALEQLGISRIDCYNDGQTAWEKLKAGEEPDLIIQEWRISKISGDILIQKTRQHGFHSVAIIVFSSLVKTSDRMLLREMGVTEVIEKPSTPKKLPVLLKAILKEEKRPKEIKSLERQVRQAIEAFDFTLATKLYDQLKVMDGLPEATKMTLEAEFAYHQNKLELASQLAVEAVHLAGEDIILLNLLGKIYMKMRKFKQATQFFARAQQLAPSNVERLCHLAESQAEADQNDKAEESLGKAKKLDKDNELLIETEAKIALNKGESSRAKDLLEQMENPSSVVAFLNNRGVALASDKRFDEGIELYRKALKALPKEMDGLKPLISYNMALALIKAGDIPNAHRCLEETKAAEDSAIDHKIKSLLKKTTKAITTGEPLVLAKAGESKPQEEFVNVNGKLPIASDTKPGEFCCHLVFHCASGVDKHYGKLLLEMPRVKPREAIKKGDAANMTTKRAM